MLRGERTKDFIVESENFVASILSLFPSAKAHTTITSVKSITDLKELTTDEWSSLLPVLKEVIQKINRVYHPVGYNVKFPVGKMSQSIKHFYVQVAPKYKKGYGYYWDRWAEREPSPQKYQEIKSKLGTNKEGIIIEKDKVVAKLVSLENPPYAEFHTIIAPRKSISNEIDKMDPETWSQMGEVLQKTIKKMEDKLGAEGFSITLPLGKLTGREEKTHSEFQFHLYPATSETRSRHPWSPIPRIDSKRIARKILDPDNPEYSYRDKTNQQIPNNSDQRERERASIPLKTTSLLFSLWEWNRNYFTRIRDLLIASQKEKSKI